MSDKEASVNYFAVKVRRTDIAPTIHTKAMKKKRMIECAVRCYDQLIGYTLPLLQCRLNSEVATKKSTKNTIQTPQGERKSD